jgi:hypothetical protein
MAVGFCARQGQCIIDEGKKASAMSNFGPPQIYPPVPINEPGNGPQGPITTEPGVYQNFFQPAQQVAPLSTALGVPISPNVIPPNVFQGK